ncbi:hypothetical protein PENCOP_c002G03587 [Penicillium coprophilum]|uniref:C3H1-type domain-containing protein n=1 Tax=Penicillium coprophilum TaxID=36646 RepID=A0A1V6V2C9_9EURO|nr:hypothetical protein PENCOP_c002G03587 [Penicillium coprophilum]
MTSQGFSFPPPPPPPPATTQVAQQPTQHGQNWGGHGGHGGGHGGGQRGRGRGQGNRGRGGHHAAGQAPSYLPPTGFNYAQPMYGGYAPQPLPTAPYMPPQTYHHGQSSAFQNPQNPPSFPSQQYPQPIASGNYQHYNTPNLPTPYPPTPPTYIQGLPTPPHGHPPNNQAMMAPISWRNDMPGAAPYMGAQPGQARGPRPPHAHGNQGPKPKHTQKRDHSSAFNKPQSTAPRTTAAPAVPSFGNPLPSKPPPAADSTANRKAKKRKRKHNQLGLTPHTEDHESSEEEADEDEESKLAQIGSDAAPLQVSYKGKTSTLQTPSDIAAWIAERRKKFPTKARVEEKKKSMEEAKAAREAVRQQKQKEQQEKRREHIQKQNEHKTDPAADATTNAQRREKIRRNLEREEKRIQKAMAETEAARLRMEALQKEALSLNVDFNQEEVTGITPVHQLPPSDPVIQTEPANAMPEPTIKTEPDKTAPEPAIITEPETAVPEATLKTEPQEPSPESTQLADPIPHAAEVQGDPGCLPESNNLEATINTEHPTDDGLDGMEIASDHEASDWTSSGASGTDSDSDSDSDDSAPEQATSRRTGPERVPPPPREGKKTVCRYFARNGHCNRGDQCKFLHENDPERTSKAKAKPTEKKEKETRRKGLYQALLDRQTEDNDRRAMEVIFWLGQNDMLAD